MYDYSKQELFKIENVEHEVHILGVTLPAMPWCIYIFLGLLTINPFFAFGGTFIFIGVVRKFYFATQNGTPIEYRPWFTGLSRKLSLLTDLFPTLSSIKHPEEVYRA